MKRLASLILTISLLTTAYAGPRLTVIVAVDGLQSSDLNRLRNYWPQGGMRTLSEEAFQTEVGFPQEIYGGSEAVATLMTGTTPQEHGIAMDTYYLRSERKAHSIFEDNTQKGIGCSQRLSPKALLSMTISDRFRLAAGEKAHIYALGLDPYTTLCLAGHSANAACWFDPAEEHFCATTYYSEGLPSAADKMNTSGRIGEFAAREWTPRMDIAQYMAPTEHERQKSFAYIGFQNGHAPAVNDLMVELALNLQKENKMGENATPDMLLLQLTVQSPLAASDHIASAEQEDMYLSLNQDLGYLMEQLDKRIGKQNYQILVLGLPRLGSSAQTLKMTGLPLQEFNVDRASALLGTYLMALYGHERWIDGGYGQTIYLNRTLIEQKKLSLATFRQQVSDFMLEFEGVQGAATVTDIPLLQGNEEVNRLRNSLTKQTRGDVVFWLNENWVVVNGDKGALDHVVDRNPEVPVLLWSGSFRNYPDKGDVSALNLYSLLFD